MNRFLYTFLLLFYCIGSQCQTYQGPVPAPTSGYGSWGSNEVAMHSFPSPLFAGKNVEIFYPKNATTPRPTVFFAHGFGGNQSEFYKVLLQFLASKGYVAVFSPYQTTGTDLPGRYNTLWEGFKKAATNYPQLIDTTRVGFAGHSFGGGASFEMARRAIVEQGWGKNGKFIAPYAPWYLLEITQSELQNFPSDTKLLLQIYEEDAVNDHRIAIDAFENINIADSEKDLVFVKADQVAGYTYEAGHNVPSSREVYDAHDAYVVFRLTEALADYTFTGNATAKNIALGNGSAAQVTMPTYNGYLMKPLVVTDNPTAIKAESFYQFACSDLANPRRSYCAQVTTPSKEIWKEDIQIFPNPGSDQLFISGIDALGVQLQILNLNRQVMISKSLQGNQAIDISKLPSGIYIARIIDSENETIITKKLLVQ